MKYKIISIGALFLCCNVHLLFSQNSAFDSLLNKYKNSKHDTTRIQLLLKIGGLYDYKKPDSALYYYQKALAFSVKTTRVNKNTMALLQSDALRCIGNTHSEQGSNFKAIDYYLKSLKIKNKLGDKKGMSACYNGLGNAYSDQSSYDKAIEFYRKALIISEELGNKKEVSGYYNNIGIVYWNQGIYEKAIEHYLKALKISEEIGDKKGMSHCYLNIGNVHSDQESYDKGNEYFNKALKIKEELGDKNGMSYCFTNIGITYYYQENYEKANEYYFKALRIKEELGDKRGMAACYNNIGINHKEEGHYEKAIEYYLKSLQIREEIGDLKGKALVYGNIASLHLTLADSSTNKVKRDSHLKAALEYGNKAYKQAIEVGALPMQNDAAAHLQKAYTKLGRYKEAILYAEIFIATQDSMFSDDKTEALAEMSSKYESEKKQLEIEKMQKQKELDNKTIEAQQAKSRKQQIIIFSAIGGFLIVLCFSVIILRMFRQKRKANVLLAKQNCEIQQKNEEISTQRDEIETQRDLVYIQKEHIEVIHKKVTDSINYAKRIQEAVLPTREAAAIIFGEHFILFRPKDIVSGDLYWGTRINEWQIVTVADCTGHGVPGAFMSMLGVSFLNEIVRKKEITKASEVLDHLRISIIEALQQKGQMGEQKTSLSAVRDGMDIALCAINVNTLQMQFAGANNSCFIIQNAPTHEKTTEVYLHQNKTLIELKGDKMPVAIHEKMNDFTNHIFQLQKGDTIYLTSDGYADQFGGPKGKKFYEKQLKELLLANFDLPMNDQKEALNSALENWRSFGSDKHDQIDDVTILGIRV